MGITKQVQVEIAYALPQVQYLMTVMVAANSTIEQAIQCSGILKYYPDLDLRLQKIGIFSQPRQLTDPVQEGDRIEIYRPLTIDPKERRRINAKTKASRS